MTAQAIRTTLPGTEFGHDDALRSGNLEVRLARNAAEIDAAQALRYRVFFEELGATPSGQVHAARRDVDKFDAYCDHLLVLDHAMGEGPDAIVGTYRLLRRSVAEMHDGFYTATEFDITPILSMPGELLELGRSCVDAQHRTRPTMQLLWKGIAAYVFAHDIKAMFGCASLPGTDPAAHAAALSYLHYNHLAPPEVRARALPERHVPMNILPAGAAGHADAMQAFDARTVIAALPPLIKGYLRLGGFVGDGAVVDHEFNTIDVCILVVTDTVTDKYFRHYSRQVGGGTPD
ncbi:MAG: GNAT family N-acetyltransferase [Alphaproteobacteria bacterium]|nr:GNAT family N-acetyltransferase [Alphaproteobacteria bacterium]